MLEIQQGQLGSSSTATSDQVQQAAGPGSPLNCILSSRSCLCKNSVKCH